MELIEFNAPARFAEMFNNSEFSERLYFSLKDNNIDIPYGVWHSKFLKNGLVKIVKALGIYKVEGARSSKKIKIHPRLKLIIDSTCGNNKQISNTIIDLVNGKYLGIDKFEIYSLDDFNNLPDNDIFSTKPGFGTYIIKNEDTGLFKIGRSKNVMNRFVDLKKEHGNNLHIVAFKSEDIEQFLHEKYKYNRFFGEWFNFDIDVVLDIVNEYNFNYLNKKNEKDLINFLNKKND